MTVPEMVRILRGAVLLGQCSLDLEETLVEHAIRMGLSIPTNCTSGTCGTCLVTLISGDVPVDEELPPGLDDDYVEQGGRLGCIGKPTSAVDIDIRPPL
jgi:ferredoxin